MTPAIIGDADIRALARTSLSLIRGLQDPSGAYPASPAFSAYIGYSWFRDGSFIADAASAAGAADSAEAFFGWCADVIRKRAALIEEIVGAAASGTPMPEERMLAARFTFDGCEGIDEWWDFQLDGYGTWLWAVAAHSRRHSGSARGWADAIELCTRYLVSSWSRPCFDWWEEHSDRVHISTLGCITAGLRAALAVGVLTSETADAAARTATQIDAVLAGAGVHDTHLVKWQGSTAVDGSLASLVGILGVVEATSPIGLGTIAALERDLVRDGGTFRYLGDTFFGGGQWPLLSCMLGQAQLAAGNPVRARELLEWAASTADIGGALPEQVDWHLGDPTYVQEWVQRWGPVAQPLLWSHAMVLRLALDLGIATPEDLRAAPTAAADRNGSAA